MVNGKLKIEEVAMLIGCSTESINCWYRYKKRNPKSAICKLLPDFEQNGERQTRFWTQADVYKLIEFQSKLPRGRNGLMGKYNGKGTKNGSRKNSKKVNKKGN